MNDGDVPGLALFRAQMIDAIRDAYNAPGFGSFESRRIRRTFDPTWRRMETETRQFAAALRSRGYAPDAAIAEVRAALDEAISGLAPYHPIRASVIGWCVDAFAERENGG